MGLNNYESSNVTYVSISKGRFFTKLKDREPVFYTDLLAYITKVEFRDDEYNCKKFELAKFTMIEDGRTFILQIRTDSGYFRSLVNCLKSGNTKEKYNIIPNFKEIEGKTKTTCFVKQDGKTLKHFHTINNMGDLPEAKKVVFKGQEVWDSSNQLSYWKNWLMKADWYNPSNNKKDDEYESTIPSDLFQEEDDLPF